LKSLNISLNKMIEEHRKQSKQADENIKELSAAHNNEKQK